MKRSVLALGASVLALALTAGPAAADPGPGQSVADSTGAAQIGAVSVDAPVRVLSDGNSATTGASAGGPQTTSDSTGSAQVTSVEANAPVRVLSDGDDADTGGSGPEQSVDDSAAPAQAGSPSVDAPVRVLSDGDNTTAGATGGSPQTTSDSTGSAQVGGPAVYAPIRVASGESTPSDDPDDTDVPDMDDVVAELVDAVLDGSSGAGGDDVVSTPSSTSGQPSGESGGSPSPVDLLGLRDGSDPGPAVRFISDAPGNATSGEVHALGVSAASLPYTGVALVATAALGLWLLSGGLALRLVPGGKRR